ncbi:MAG: hypothetical protein ABSG89_02355 [Bacteroidales bacterium]
MKKLITIVVCLTAAVFINAQSLTDIVGKYTEANKLDKISGFKTVRVSAKVSVMGQDMPIEMWMKNPNKIKTVTTFNGQDIVQAYDGEKGYMINPMAGTADVTEMSEDQVKELTRNNIFQNYMEKYLKDGILTLEGEDTVKGNKAFKIKAALPGGNNTHLFIDKISYLLVKTEADINQGGMEMTVDSYPSDYTLNNGIMMPMKTTSSMGGMDMVMTVTKVEVDTPIEDSIFKLK